MSTRAGMLEMALKRAMDVLLAGALIVLLLPLLLLAAVLVKLSSPGPILFRQQRVGRGEALFRVYKFRSMRVGSGGPQVTAGNDTRITPAGRRLRQWKLDELPQLFNVLRGEMSLVGPRPEVPRYLPYYTNEQRRVLSVRPGITGVCQLAFRHEETILAAREDPESYYIHTLLPEKLELDLRYIRERTVFGDLRLLVRTLGAITRRAPRTRATP
jgi:lipopolysaccharide/colanic/teichoic acid biosynthesis glycosyltransferase